MLAVETDRAGAFDQRSATIVIREYDCDLVRQSGIAFDLCGNERHLRRDFQPAHPPLHPVGLTGDYHISGLNSFSNKRVCNGRDHSGSLADQGGGNQAPPFAIDEDKL